MRRIQVGRDRPTSFASSQTAAPELLIQVDPRSSGRQSGWLRVTSTKDALIFDLTDEARSDDRSYRLIEDAMESTN